MKRILSTLCALGIGALVQTQAVPLAGCFSIDPPGSWSEFLIGGQPGAVGNQINAHGPNYAFEGATLAVVTSDPSGEWDWITRYDNATLTLNNVPGAPWFGPCDNVSAYVLSFPEVWVKTRSTRYAATNAGYLEFELTAAMEIMNVIATYAGMPSYTPQTNGTTEGILASANLSSAGMCIGKVVHVVVNPSSLNVKSKGVLTAVVLGTDSFDVKSIKPASIRLQCVPALRWSYADISSDGDKDLVLKFDRQAIVRALASKVDRQMVPLLLTGELKDGNPISGADEVRILNKGKPTKNK